MPIDIAFNFAPCVYHGETATAEHGGFVFTATIHHDDHQDPPWDNECGHGTVSDWTRRDKLPGELVLCAERHGKMFYDYADACRIARRDGWRPRDGGKPGESKRSIAARAAREDFERMRDWCRDEWCYVGVAVTVSRRGVTLTGTYDHALWGIESDAGEYLNEVAAELADEALDAAVATIASLA